MIEILVEKANGNCEIFTLGPNHMFVQKSFNHNPQGFGVDLIREVWLAGVPLSKLVRPMPGSGR